MFSDPTEPSFAVCFCGPCRFNIFVHIVWSAHAQFNFAKMLSALLTKVGGAAYLLTAQVLLAKPKICLFEKHSTEPSHCKYV
jgi:hypothetical protein